MSAQFQSQSGSLTCMLSHLHAMDSPDSLLVHNTCWPFDSQHLKKNCLGFLEDISPICGAKDTDIFPEFKKSGWIPCMLFCLCDPHLWCDTYWLYRGQHGSWAFSIHVLTDMSTSIGGGSGLKSMTVCIASTVLYTIQPLWCSIW